MAQVLHEDAYMPYAPLQPVLDVIRRFRERGLPEVVSRAVLHQLGAAEGNSDRIQKALQFLDLIDADGKRTATFSRLGKASETEYQEVLAEIVRAAYSQILTIVDPNDGDIPINDAFRHYEPTGQRGRMVALFLGLCREAGMVSGGPVERRPRAKRVTTGNPPSRTRRTEVLTNSTNNNQDDGGAGEAPPPSGADYRLLSALIQQLPRDGTWTQARRDRWLQAFTANIDLLVEVDEGVAKMSS
jgi:Family of unknown function (DUF5343)